MLWFSFWLTIIQTIFFCVQWALIANRINSILGLALDFYSIQHMLGSDGAVSATKARCEMEVDRIEKQFDDCIAFLLRVSFQHLFFFESLCSNCIQGLIFSMGIV